MPSAKETSKTKTATKAKRDNFEIAGHSIAPGERLKFDLPGAALYTNTPLGTSVEVIHGKRPGPTLLVCSAVHGDELNGVEIIRRLRALSSINKVAGTLVLVPVVNLHGFINQSRYLPDRRDLNRCFPGRRKGSLGSRLAHGFFNQVVRRCTHVIDLHTAAIKRDNLPQIRADLATPGIQALALGFSIPVIIDAALIDKSLRAEAGSIGIPVITYEAGEALRLSEKAVVTGVRGITNTMCSLGMLPASKTQASESKPQIAQSTTWLRASADGMFRATVELGQHVKKGDTLGIISSPFNTTENLVSSRVEGIVIGMARQPLVNEGEALFNIARFSKVRAVEKRISAYNKVIATDPLFGVEQIHGTKLS